MRYADVVLTLLDTLPPATILVYRTQGTFSTLIRCTQWFTRGPQSMWAATHAVLLLEDRMALATSHHEGVYLERLEPDEVDCCDECDPVVLTPEITPRQRRQIVGRAHARMRDATPYTKRGAVVAGLGLGTPGSGRVCSTLAAELYAEVGAPLTSKPWYHVSPVDLAALAVEERGILYDEAQL